MDKGSTGATVHVQDEFYELHWSATAYTGAPLWQSIPATAAT